MVGLIRDRIAQPDCAGGFILDGFPRTEAQAKALDQMLAETGKKLDRVIEMEVDEKALTSASSAVTLCRVRHRLPRKVQAAQG